MRTIRMNKKLQVFVSSTYTDLKEERQAAVEAILDAGHIPAGMELFKAGNDSQLKTIYKWIDESDVYMLILGGRYGSVEAKSGKSYTQLEYEYALSKNIPVFAVVVSQSFLTTKINTMGYDKVTEQVYPEKHRDFKAFVMSKIVREVDDCKDIKIQVHATLNEFIHNYNLIGWVRDTNEDKLIQLLEDKNELLEKNNALNRQVQELQRQIAEKNNEQLGRYSFDDIIHLFSNKVFQIPAKIAHTDTDVHISALDLYKEYHDLFIIGISNGSGTPDEIIYIFNHIVPYYVHFDFLERVKLSDTNAQRIHTTKLGNAFYAMLESKNSALPQ